MQVAPPASRFRHREVNENALARPDFRHKEIAIATVLEKLLLYSLIVRVIAFVLILRLLDSRIDDRYDLHTLATELVSQTFRSRKSFLVESEDAITVHVIDVEMYDVEREVATAILVHDFFDHRVRVVTPPTLLVAECPQRRQRHMSGQVCVAAEDLLNRWTVKKVIVHLAAFSAKPRALLRRFAEIEIAAIAVVEENSVSDAALQADVERDRLVDRIFAFSV